MALYRCLSQLSKIESALCINSRVGWGSLLIEKFLSLKFKPQHKECKSEEVAHVLSRRDQSTATRKDTKKACKLKDNIKEQETINKGRKHGCD